VQTYKLAFLGGAECFIKTLPHDAPAKIMATIKMMSMDMSVVNIRKLGRAIHELKINKYRILFFIDHDTICFVSGFIKKSAKTPVREIRNAETIFKKYINTKTKK